MWLFLGVKFWKFLLSIVDVLNSCNNKYVKCMYLGKKLNFFLYFDIVIINSCELESFPH